MKKFCVLKPYETPFKNPIYLMKGESVKVEDKECEWEGWLWCTNSKKMSGWIPEEYLEKLNDIYTLKINYDATELNVKIGEIVEGEQEVAGWIWCKNDRQIEGWVPKENLERIE